MLIFAAGRLSSSRQKETIYQRIEKDYKSNKMAALFVANNIRARAEAQRSQLARVWASRSSWSSPMPPKVPRSR